jgi:hypothetical protein
MSVDARAVNDSFGVAMVWNNGQIALARKEPQEFGMLPRQVSGECSLSGPLW